MKLKGRTMKELKEQVRELIADIIEVETEEVSGDTSFVEDLGADSLKALELLSQLEKDLEIGIHESNLKRLSTLNNTMAVLSEIMEGQEVEMET
jgi:acyl carrier protein